MILLISTKQGEVTNTVPVHLGDTDSPTANWEAAGHLLGFPVQYLSHHRLIDGRGLITISANNHRAGLAFNSEAALHAGFPVYGPSLLLTTEADHALFENP